MAKAGHIVIKPRHQSDDGFITSILKVHKTSANLKETMDTKCDDKQSKKPSSIRHPLLNRMIVLKNLQLAVMEMKAEFYTELFELEQHHQLKMNTLSEKRHGIINGRFIIPPGFHRHESLNRLEVAGQSKYQSRKVPNFWLAVLLHTPVIKNMIKPRDITVLGFLNDIRISYQDQSSFTIEFHFDRNEYFSNSMLKKTYLHVTTIDEDDPFSYDGPEIYRSEGCTIYWKNGKNLMLYRAPENTETDFLTEYSISEELVHMTQHTDQSFFSFFNPPQFPMEKVVVDMELERILTIDFEIGNFLRKKVIPSAIWIYLKGLGLHKKVQRPEMVEESKKSDISDQSREPEESNKLETFENSVLQKTPDLNINTDPMISVVKSSKQSNRTGQALDK